jgi:hypothetical protein
MSLSKQSDFQKLMAGVVGPKLDTLGFKEVLLKDCMRPELLFNKGRIWFGASWDYRDQYLDVTLGHLYWFKDVMPRVIVLGDYAAYISQMRNLQEKSPGYLTRVAETVRDTIESALRIYEQRYEEMLAERKDATKLKYPKEFFIHLGSEVTKEELVKFAT